ncbi:MAG: DUF6384 family protein [Xanthomonadales bacterium]|nr:DUF6384 family protein [Xanthomonadales bacterium]
MSIDTPQAVNGRDRADVAPAPAADNGHVGLDQLMLAMDVVDTLRHQQDLVDQALAEDSRSAALIERIRGIYANQGIEVPDSVIAEGVEALRRDRFVYQPPASGWSRRLAGIYVERWRWAKRGALTAILATVVWAGIDIPRQLEDRRRVSAQSEQLDTVQTRLARADQALAGLGREQQAVELPGSVRAGGEKLLAQAGQQAGRARDALAQTRSARWPQAGTDAAIFSRDLAAIQMPLAEAEQALEQAAGLLADAGGLGQLAQAFGRVRSALLAANVAPSVRSELDELIGQAGAALQAGDVALARGRIDRLDDIAATLDLSYQLRIVSRPDVQSGVWRHPADNAGARNYYIIVDAIGADGQPLPLPITSEEDQSTRRVSRFGIRVPEQVYQQVRADKLDNGLIDNWRFGEKRRGELEPRYHFNVAGGHITAW